MAYRDMQQNLLGDIPGTILPQVKKAINRALELIYKTQRWSFQFTENGWLTPGLLGGTSGPGSTLQSPGKITVSPYTNTITGDATASAAWTGMVGRPFITEYQIRIPYYSLYSIVAMDATTPTAVVLTIDRPWMEPKQTNAAYMAYQVYFPAPLGFKNWLSAVDTTNNSPMNWSAYTRADLDELDPQRVVFNQPEFFVPYQVDSRPNSATFGQMLFELWPHPLQQLPYTWRANVEGPLLAQPTDTVPFPLDDELVEWRAKEVLYQWKEAQKGDQMQRGSGADWKFLAQEAHAQYEMRLKKVSLVDAGLASPYWSKFKRDTVTEPFANVLGGLNVGRF